METDIMLIFVLLAGAWMLAMLIKCCFEWWQYWKRGRDWRKEMDSMQRAIEELRNNYRGMR